MSATVEEIEELYRSRYASYRGGVAALTGYDAARDVVQEAFAQALRDRAEFRGEGSLAAWVWRITFRTALRTRTKGGRELTVDELVEAAPVPRAERDPELAEAVPALLRGAGSSSTSATSRISRTRRSHPCSTSARARSRPPSRKRMPSCSSNFETRRQRDERDGQAGGAVARVRSCG